MQFGSFLSFCFQCQWITYKNPILLSIWSKFQIKSTYILYADNSSFCFSSFSVSPHALSLAPTIVHNFIFVSFLSISQKVIWNNLNLQNVCRNSTRKCRPFTQRAPFMFCLLPHESILDHAMHQLLWLSSLLLLHLLLTFMTFTFLKIWASNFVEYPSIYICHVFSCVASSCLS